MNHADTGVCGRCGGPLTPTGENGEMECNNLSRDYSGLDGLGQIAMEIAAKAVPDKSAGERDCFKIANQNAAHSVKPMGDAVRIANRIRGSSPQSTTNFCPCCSGTQPGHLGYEPAVSDSVSEERILELRDKLDESFKALALPFRFGYDLYRCLDELLAARRLSDIPVGEVRRYDLHNDRQRAEFYSQQEPAVLASDHSRSMEAAQIKVQDRDNAASVLRSYDGATMVEKARNVLNHVHELQNLKRDVESTVSERGKTIQQQAERIASLEAMVMSANDRAASAEDNNVADHQRRLNTILSLTEERDRLQRELAEAKVNDARYRWLRDPTNAIVYAKDRNAWGKGASGHVAWQRPEQLDVAIDHATSSTNAHNEAAK